MHISRRRAVGLIGSTVALPYLLTSRSSAAAPRLRLLGQPIELGKNVPGGKRSPSLSVFPNGDFIAGFVNDASSGNTSVFIRYYTSAGHPLSGNIRMGAATGPTDGSPALSVAPVANADGTTLILFSAEQNGAAIPDRYDIFGQRMAADRSKDGLPFRLNKKTTDRQGDALFATSLAQTTPSIMAAWADQGLTLDSWNVRSRSLGSDGADPLREQLAAPTNGMQVPTSLVPTREGGAILGFMTFQPDVNQWRAALQPLAPDASRIGKPILNKPLEEPLPVNTICNFRVAQAWGRCDVALARKNNTTAKLNVRTVTNGQIGFYTTIATFPVDEFLVNPIRPPLIVTLPDQTDGDIGVIAHYALAGDGSGGRTVGAQLVGIPALEPIGDYFEIHRSPTDWHPTSDSLVRATNDALYYSFSDTDGNPQHSKSYVQRAQLVHGP